MKCAYCGEEIEVQPLTGWDRGNNGLPLVDGRVCDICNGLVILERIKLLRRQKNDD